MTHSEILTMLGDYVDYLIAHSSAEPESASGKPNKWNYIDGGMITACLSLYHTTVTRIFLDFSKNFIDYFVQEDGSIQTYTTPRNTTWTTLPGQQPVHLYEIYGEEKYLKAILCDPRILAPHQEEATSGTRTSHPWEVWLDAPTWPSRSIWISRDPLQQDAGLHWSS